MVMDVMTNQQGSQMESMMLNGTHLQISTLLSIILLRIFLERWEKVYYFLKSGTNPL